MDRCAQTRRGRLLLVVVGVRFERTMIALAISAVFLVVFVILGHNDEV